MEQEKIMTIHCASCGAPAQYDIVKQNYHCPNCGEDTGTEIPLKKLREFRSLTKTLLEQELRTVRRSPASVQTVGHG